MSTLNQKHVYQHNDETVRFSIEVERNTRGYNWKVSASNITVVNIDQTFSTVEALESSLKLKYGEKDGERSTTNG